LIKAFDVVNDQPFGIIHIDSHTDLMDSFEGHHWSHACTGRRHLEATNLAPQHLAFIGIRSWLQEEVEILKDLNQVQVHSAKSLYKRGIQAIVDDVITQMEGLSRIYLTLDIDCLDPAFAPGTGTPESGGMSSRELLTLLEGLFTALPIHAMDIVEVSPPLDHSDITSMLAIKIIYEVLGWIANTDTQSNT
jgi:agmatinase